MKHFDTSVATGACTGELQPKSVSCLQWSDTKTTSHTK